MPESFSRNLISFRNYNGVRGPRITSQQRAPLFDHFVGAGDILAFDVTRIIESPSKRVDGRPGLDRQDTDCDYLSSCLLLRAMGGTPLPRKRAA